MADRFALSILATVMIAACQTSRSVPESEPPAGSTDEGAEGSVAQARVGGSGPARELGFVIAGVFEKQKPTDSAPWHTDGGDWVYFDAEVAGAGFAMGFKSKPLQGMPFEFGEARVIGNDAKQGAALVAAFAKAFGVPAPPRGRVLPLTPLKASAVVLARDAKRNPGGSFSGKGGGWIAAKWTFEGDGDPAEVFVNVNLEEKKGELSEKDTMYNADVAKYLAKAWRDGH